MESEIKESDIPADAQTAADVELPANAAERKRVLNILAQRRYRRRRREKQTALEILVSQKTNKCSTPSVNSTQHPMVDLDSSPEYNDTSSPSSDDSRAPTDPIVPYRNGSTWWPIDVDPGIEFSSLLSNDAPWTTDLHTSALNIFLQSDDVQNATFADDFIIAVPELDLLRAAYEIAGRLHSSHLLFAGLEAQSVFIDTDCSSWITKLPKNLQPTAAQLTTPHHPLIDCLPWPAVRNRLIGMYSLPSDLWPRHPSDGTASSIVRLVYDMEDGGVRVSGADPSDQDAWEVEQRFFEVWWWALDQSVINNTDCKRMMRGLPRLSCANAVEV